MENSEEDTLKRFLQDTFSDYEPKPSYTTWENIRKEIQAQPSNVGTVLRQWIVLFVALLLLISGVVWNGRTPESKSLLTLNLTKENALILNQSRENRPFKGRIPYFNRKIVNKTTLEDENRGLLRVKKSFEVAAISTIFTEPIKKRNVHEYGVGTREFLGIDDKSIKIYAVVNVSTEYHPSIKSKQPGLNSDSLDLGILGLSSEDKLERSVNPVNPNSDRITYHNHKAINQKSLNLTDINLINDGVIEEVRHIKNLETLKNKDFVSTKHELRLSQISEINISREAKLIRRPLYVSVSIMPLQTYRILTVSDKNIQDL